MDKPAQIIENLHKAHVLCIGDIMLDTYVYGEIERISPEAPVPILQEYKRESMLGGAGNVVRNLRAAGAGVTIISLIGADATGDILTTLCAQDSNITSHFISDSKRPTTLKTRFIAEGQQTLRVDNESRQNVAPTTEDQLIETAIEVMGQVSTVVVSDYGKGVVSDKMCRAILKAAKGKTIIVDPKGTDYAKYKGATILTPNRKELAAATGLPVGDESEIIAAALSLIQAHKIEYVLVTLSAAGMMLVGENGRLQKLGTKAREVYDVSGAGDTVVSILAACLDVGAPLAQAMQIANAAAGVVVAKKGTAVAYSGEILNALEDSNLLNGKSKILDLKAAQDRVAGWQQKGLKVGFTNGTFDLIHPGHVSSLAQARAHCDKLVVALNTDASVRRYKGPDRPVQNEQARTAVLASLENVDLVLLFGADTPIEEIKTLKPDVLVKGADYRIDQVVGADVVQAYGGKVILARLEEGFSTSNTIKKLKA